MILSPTPPTTTLAHAGAWKGYTMTHLPRAMGHRPHPPPSAPSGFLSPPTPSSFPHQPTQALRKADSLCQEQWDTGFVAGLKRAAQAYGHGQSAPPPTTTAHNAANASQAYGQGQSTPGQSAPPPPTCGSACANASQGCGHAQSTPIFSPAAVSAAQAYTNGQRAPPSPSNNNNTAQAYGHGQTTPPPPAAASATASADASAAAGVVQASSHRQTTPGQKSPPPTNSNAAKAYGHGQTIPPPPAATSAYGHGQSIPPPPTGGGGGFIYGVATGLGGSAGRRAESGVNGACERRENGVNGGCERRLDRADTGVGHSQAETCADSGRACGASGVASDYWPRIDGSRRAGLGVDGLRVDAPGMDGPRIAGPRIAGPRIDGSPAAATDRQDAAVGGQHTAGGGQHTAGVRPHIARGGQHAAHVRPHMCGGSGGAVALLAPSPASDVAGVLGGLQILMRNGVSKPTPAPVSPPIPAPAAPSHLPVPAFPPPAAVTACSSPVRAPVAGYSSAVSACSAPAAAVTMHREAHRSLTAPVSGFSSAASALARTAQNGSASVRAESSGLPASGTDDAPLASVFSEGWSAGMLMDTAPAAALTTHREAQCSLSAVSGSDSARATDAADGASDAGELAGDTALLADEAVAADVRGSPRDSNLAATNLHPAVTDLDLSDWALAADKALATDETLAVDAVGTGWGLEGAAPEEGGWAEQLLAARSSKREAATAAWPPMPLKLDAIEPDAQPAVRTQADDDELYDD